MGPMRLAINESTRQDKHKNQKIVNINYDQNSMSIFRKTLNNKMNMESDKP